MRIQELLDKLKPDQWLAMREAFENEYTYICNVDGLYWVGVNVPDSHKPLAREGYYSYGEHK